MARSNMSARARARSNELLWIRDSSSTILPASNAGTIIDFGSRLDAQLGETARNYTIERILGNFVLTVPASTAAGRNYTSLLEMDVYNKEASGFPEPYTDQSKAPWSDARTVFADHTVPASYASPAINGIIDVDVRSKRMVNGLRESFALYGNHDNGLGTNPTIFWSYSMLVRVR